MTIRKNEGIKFLGDCKKSEFLHRDHVDDHGGSMSSSLMPKVLSGCSNDFDNRRCMFGTGEREGQETFNTHVTGTTCVPRNPWKPLRANQCTWVKHYMTAPTATSALIVGAELDG